MADKYVNAVGVQTIKTWVEGKFALDADLDALSDRVDDIVAEGGEPNKIDTISVNGTNVPPDAQKNVELTVPEVTTTISGSGTSATGHGIITQSGSTKQEIQIDVLGSYLTVTDINGSNYASITLQSAETTNTYLRNKQDKLVSGTNIKTINNESLLGSGNLDIAGAFVATYGTTSYADVHAAIEDGKSIILNFNGTYATPTQTLTATEEHIFVVIQNVNGSPTLRHYMVNGEGWSEATFMNMTLAKAEDVPTVTSDLTNDGDGTSNFATEAYVDANGGKIDVIKVNGTAQTITNKEVDLTVPTKVSDITNDSGFQTASDVGTAITTALANGSDPYQTASDVQSSIDSAVAAAYKYKGSVATYADLPSTGVENGDVYDVQATGMNYAWREGSGGAEGTWDALGQFVDTSVFWTSVTGQTNTLEAMTVAEINAILEPTTP